ncbi:glycosyl hydrolase [Enemella evansiae]|uniref:ThuA domain-containing protein n=1 Tax=Enemella evansiae TaxID=2016499 RepID=UPI000B97B3D7|nr:ThuA domain-containing protein [Enemella evansiae]OYN94749.1 glycosyl hydrolase [Enemella evansiae]
MNIVTPRVRVLTGDQRYADPWHPFAETGAALRDWLAEAYPVELRTDEPDALGELAGIDLLVVNCGIGADPANPPAANAEWDAAFAACERWLADGGRVLGVHTAANTFGDWPAWRGILGGRWIRGTSMHPPRGPSRFRVLAPDHPTLAGLTEVEAEDERYSLLSRDSGTVPLLDHDLDGSAEVMAWASADGRAVYSGLGHDARAYDSPTAKRFVTNAARWLLGDREVSPPASPG